MENLITERLKQHSSCREFLDKTIEPELIEEILSCAQMSSSSCFLQVTSIIRVTDQKLKDIFAIGCKQEFIAKAPEFWIFCGDFHRDNILCNSNNIGYTDHFLVACLDTGIMAQSAMMAIESLGLGGVFVGGIRDCANLISLELSLPKHTLPLVGLAFGYPKYRNEIKPRLPSSVIFMENRYVEPDRELLKSYDEQMSQYYLTRTRNAKKAYWSEQLNHIINRESRAYLLEFLKSKGWLLK